MSENGGGIGGNCGGTSKNCGGVSQMAFIIGEFPVRGMKIGLKELSGNS